MESCFELPDEYRRLRDECEELARSVEPLAAEADASHTVHEPMLAALRASGLCGLMVPAAYGGRLEDVDPVAVCVAREAFMAVSGHLDSLFAMQGIGSFALSRGGSEELRRAWLPKVAAGEAIAALALTEPQVGSDLRNITTRVSERDGALILDGEKSYITNGGFAHCYTVFALEDAGPSLFLVPADAAGLRTEVGPALSPPHVVGSVWFDGVRLDPDSRIGASGEGMDLALATLATFRVSVGAAAVGLAAAALEEAAAHAITREQFGKPLARLGAVAAMLADSWTDIESARLLVYRAAELARGEPAANVHFSSMAKVAASEAADRVADRAVQTMGRFGLVADSKINRLYREARAMRIAEGSSEVLRLVISRALTDPGRRPAAGGARA